MPAASLRAMAISACIRNVTTIQDLGDIDYNLALPILKKIDNPDQLLEIERNSPHIADHDAELWKAFLRRDTMKWASEQTAPKNPRSWHLVYKKCIREEKRENDKLEKLLIESMTESNKQIESNTTGILKEVIAPPERRWRGGAETERARLARATAPEGQKFMKNARREAAMSLRGPAKTATDRAKLRAQALSQIKVAPKSMIKKPHKPPPQTAAQPKSVPKPATGIIFRQGAARTPYEDRLLALTRVTSTGDTSKPASNGPATSAERSFTAKASDRKAPSGGLEASPSIESDGLQRSTSPVPRMRIGTPKKRAAVIPGSIFMPAKKRKV